MAQTELLLTIQSLPAEEQYKLASTVLEGLGRSGRLPLSEEARRLLDQRLDAADRFPEQLIAADKVFDELTDH